MKNKKICALLTCTLIAISVSPVLATTTQSIFPAGADVVTAVNNFTSAQDTITFNGRYFSAGDVVRVYSDNLKTSEIGSPVTINAYQDDAIISVDQLGQTSGSVYVTLQDAAGDNESDVVAVPYGPEVTVINNVDNADTVTFKGLKANDIAKVYAADGSTLLGQATAATTGDITLTLTNQLSESDLAVQVTVTSNGIESSKTTVTYPGGVKTNAPTGAIEVGTNPADIVVGNNANIADTVTFLGLKAKDVATVYASDQTTVLGQATAAKDGDIVVTLANQLSESTKKIYVTVKRYGELESNQTLVQYFREVTTTDPLNTDITVTNNAGIADIISVAGLQASDVINVYSAATGGTTIGTAVVPTGQSVATVSVAQLGTGTGSVYVTKTNLGKLESNRIEKVYDAEGISTDPIAANITVVNNTTGKADTVNVSGLVPNDVVKVYSAETGGTAIGTATVAAGKTDATVSIAQLGTAAGSVYVSVTNAAKLESARVAQTYIAEPVSTAPVANNIKAVNYAGVQDVITVKGLIAGDIVKVYNVTTGGTAVATSKAVATGRTTISFNVAQLGTTSGNVYITVTNLGKLESDRTTVGYNAEP